WPWASAATARRARTVFSCTLETFLPAALNHVRGDHRRALAARPAGLAAPLPHRTVPEPATAARVGGVGARRRGSGDGTRRRPRGLHGRPLRMGLGGGAWRGQLVPPPPRGRGFRLDRRRPGRQAVRGYRPSE